MRLSPITVLDHSPVTTVKDYAQGIEGLPKSNVLTYASADGKKAIVRPSGTEPKVKVYLSVRAASRDQARASLDEMEKEISELIR